MGSDRILREKSSLQAISKLEHSRLPYAATLLVYVVLERCLKLHIVETHRNWEPRKIKHYLEKATLVDLERVCNVIPVERYSEHRNKVFHSNLYIAQDEENEQRREDANWEMLATAKGHLIEASRCYFHHPITEIDGKLRFEPEFPGCC